MPGNVAATKTENNIGRSRCFEILGFDIMVNTNLKPSLIEVNHLPSWGTDSPLNETIKSLVITQALSSINVSMQDRQNFEDVRRKKILEKGQSLDVSKEIRNVADSFARPNDREPSFFDSQCAEKRI